MLKRLKSWISVIVYFLLSIRASKAEIMDSNQTVDMILRGKSLIRFGDGEFGIYRKRGISYQPWSNELLRDFEIIKSNYDENSNYILAVPKSFFKINGLKLCKKRKYLAAWAEARYEFKKNFNQNLIYGDAFLFKKGNEEIYDRIWKAKKFNFFIFVHNDCKYATVLQNKVEKKVFFIPCPSKDAYAKKFEIEEEIKKVIFSHKLNSENTCIILSAGPSGKIIAYDFSKIGYLCIDSGHCWDEPLIDYKERSR